MANIEGKVVIVTGGAQGMGKSHCEVLAAGGAKVIVADIVEDKGAALAAAIGDNARFVRLDVTEAESWGAAVASAEQAFGPVTGLVNNAGIGYPVALDDLTEQEYRRFIDVNQVSIFLGIKAVVPSMRRRSDHQTSTISQPRSRNRRLRRVSRIRVPGVPCHSSRRTALLSSNVVGTLSS